MVSTIDSNIRGIRDIVGYMRKLEEGYEKQKKAIEAKVEMIKEKDQRIERLERQVAR